MGMDVIGIAVGGYHDFKAGDLLRQLQCDLVSGLRREILIRMEGLDHVIVHPSADLLVQSFGVHELLQGNRRNAVDTADQGTALIIYLRFLAAVAEDTVETANRLRPQTLYKIDDGHHDHLFRFKMSESKEPTCAYASVSSFRYTICTLPMLARVVS